MWSNIKHRILFFFAQAFIVYGVSAQVTIPVDPNAGLKEDTLEVIESDSTITYIIEVEPITIRDTVKIQKAKRKHKVYFSMLGSMMYVYEGRTPKPSYEYYMALIDSSTNTLYGYSYMGNIWLCPKKTYVGFNLEYRSIKQTYSFVNNQGNDVVFDNRFKYTSFQLNIGRWYRKNKTVSFIPYVGLAGDVLFSYSGYTLQRNDYSLIARIHDEIGYKKVLPTASLNLKTIFYFPNVILEVEPYVVLGPLYATQSTAVYNVRRHYAGVRLGFQTRLF